MARVPIVVEVKNATGDAVASASVTVKSRATGVNATLYNAEVAGSIISNPTIADALGRAFVWADPDNFNVTISGTGITTYTVAYDGTVGDGSVTTTKIAANAVTTSKVLDANITSPKIEAQQAWQTLTLTAGGTVTGGPLQYFKDSIGMVHLHGAMSFGTIIPASTTFATLPAGYRPGINIWGPVPADNGTGPFFLECKIFTTGAIQTIANGAISVGWTLSFDSIHFRAEN